MKVKHMGFSIQTWNPCVEYRSITPHKGDFTRPLKLFSKRSIKTSGTELIIVMLRQIIDKMMFNSRRGELVLKRDLKIGC